jgi:hypothetical protein
MTMERTIANAEVTMRIVRRLNTPSSPGLTRPSTSVVAESEDVDGRVICAKTRFALLPGDDEGG